MGSPSGAVFKDDARNFPHICSLKRKGGKTKRTSKGVGQ
jgi:hypothetical protein